MDDLTDPDCDWNPSKPGNTSHTLDKVKEYEKIIDESGQQLSEQQIRELFDFSGQSHMPKKPPAQASPKRSPEDHSKLGDNKRRWGLPL